MFSDKSRGCFRPIFLRTKSRYQEFSQFDIKSAALQALSDLKPSDSYAIMALMEKVDGWKRSKTRKRMPIYGQQRVYVRD